MNILFPSQKIKKFFNHEKELQKKFTQNTVNVIKQRLELLAAIANLGDLQFIQVTPKLHVHKLTNRGNDFAINVSPKDRLIFEPVIENPESATINDLSTIDCILIKGIEDYH